jgi:hypothetical protein
VGPDQPLVQVHWANLHVPQVIPAQGSGGRRPRSGGASFHRYRCDRGASITCGVAIIAVLLAAGDALAKHITRALRVTVAVRGTLGCSRRGLIAETPCIRQCKGTSLLCNQGVLYTRTQNTLVHGCSMWCFISSGRAACASPPLQVPPHTSKACSATTIRSQGLLPVHSEPPCDCKRSQTAACPRAAPRTTQNANPRCIPCKRPRDAIRSNFVRSIGWVITTKKIYSTTKKYINWTSDRPTNTQN